MKKFKVSDWHTNLAWAVVGLFATGFLFFFLSTGKPIQAYISAGFAVAFACLAIWLHKLKDRIVIPTFQGALDYGLTDFIDKHDTSIFRLELQFDEDQSREILDWRSTPDSDSMIWFGVLHDENGREFGFDKADKEIHWNTRFSDSVHTEGYFKVASMQGPYQGVMSVVLRGVGREHLPGSY